MRTLRSGVDAVMVGGGTVRAERLSLGLDPDHHGPVPLGVIVTNTGDVPLERNVTLDHRQDMLVLLSEDSGDAVRSRFGHLTQIRHLPADESGAIDLAGAMRTLKSDYGVSRLLLEGGPTLNHAVVSDNLANELFLTLAPALLGGSGTQDTPSILKGPLKDPRDLELLSAHLSGDELFLRYQIKAHRR